jgi:succinoglycan biosynthesis transport protein ExoP
MVRLLVSEGMSAQRYTAEITFPLLWKSVIRRKKTILVSAVMGACLAFAGSRLLPLQYMSEGTLLALPSQGSSSGAAASGAAKATSSKAGMIRAPGLLRQVVTNLHLDTANGLQPTLRLPAFIATALTYAGNELHRMIGTGDPALSAVDRTVRLVAKHLQVESEEGSDVLAVRFYAAQPQVAAAVANGVMEAYVRTTEAGRQQHLKAIAAATAQQVAENQQEIAQLEQKIAQFVQDHNMSEVQNSLTAALALEKYQDQLAQAREDLAHKQAALDTLSHGDLSGAEEVLDSKTIQKLKETRANLIELLSKLAPTDSRRVNIRNGLTGINTQIESETKLVHTALIRAFAMAEAKVQALTAAVAQASNAAQLSTGEGSALKLMQASLEGKRALNTDFATHAEQMRLAVEQTPGARILFAAPLPERPVHTYGVLSILLGFAVGIVGSAMMIVTRVVTHQKISTSQDMIAATRLPVVGCLPDLLKTSPKTTPIVDETLRAVWLTLRTPGRAERGTSVLVTSSEIGEGKTTIALATARRMAMDGSRVLLIDADLRRKHLSTTVKPDAAQPLEKVLSGEVALAEAVNGHYGVDCLLATGSHPNPISLILSDRFANLVENSRAQYDFVLLDSPPVLRVADALLIASLCEHVLYVVQADRLPGAVVEEATRRFAGTDRDKLLGLVVRADSRNLTLGDYYGGYRSFGLH